MKNLGLIILSALCFLLSFPNPLSESGWGFLAFLAFFPAWMVVKNSSWPWVIAWGALFGVLCYGGLTFWLAHYSFVALLVVILVFTFWNIVLFLGFKSLELLLPGRAAWAQSLFFVFWEYLFTLGFTGFAYGVLGYSQASFLPMIQSASWGGVWVVSLLVIFPSAYAAGFSKIKKIRFTPSLWIYLALWGLSLAFGFSQLKDFSSEAQWKPALIQHNLDPWEGGYVNYRKGLDRLISLSDKALESAPDAVIWSETAFVPSISYHERYREIPEAYQQVRLLNEYLAGQTVPFALGNGHAEKILREGKLVRADWNGALVYKKGQLDDVYKKIHLVPFTEHFPFKETWPWIWDYLKKADTHFWEAGTEFKVLDLQGVQAGFPICFEDTFGYLSREFVRNGADVLVNLTNDSWSGSRVAMDQHLGVAVFRAVENHRSMVRASNGGLTASIDPNGRVLGTLKPFTQDFLLAQVPLVRNETTLYTQWGDWFPWFALVLVLGIMIADRVIFTFDRKQKLTE